MFNILIHNVRQYIDTLCSKPICNSALCITIIYNTTHVSNIPFRKLCKDYYTLLNGHENVLQINPKNFISVPFLALLIKRNSI